MSTLKLINIATKLMFTWFFIFFSYESFRDWLLGRTVFDNINDYNENLPFPSVSLCPREKDEPLNIKLNQVRKDFNLSEKRSMDAVKTFILFASMQNIFRIIEQYSFSKLDVFPQNDSSSIL